MAEPLKKGTSSNDNWRVETLRLTAFPSQPIQVENLTWWEDLIGRKPESRNFRPRENKIREIGSFENGNLILNIEPIRLDWYFTVSNDEKEDRLDERENQESIPNLGPFSDVLKIFEAKGKAFLDKKNFKSINRLAFGAVLLKFTENREAGYKIISNYLPKIEIDAENSSDFMYQINRPRESATLKDLKLNRFSKWSVLQRKKFLFQVTPAGQTSNEEIVIQPPFACRLELDINSSSEYPQKLPHEQLTGLFQELVILGTEITIEGDIP